MKLRLVIASFSLLSCATAVAQGAPPDYAAFRAARQANLGRADGLLSVQRSVGLKAGSYSIGSAEDCVVKERHLPAHAGLLVVDQAGAVLFRQEGQPDEPLPANPTNDLHMSTDKGWVHIGPVSLAASPVKGGAHLLVKDREDKAVLTYPGLRWFPVSPAWRVKAAYTPYTTEHPLEIALKYGQIVKEPAVGFAEFKLQGQTLRLDAVEDDGHLFFVIGDKTNGTSSYGAGRFIENAVASEGMHKPGTVILDFNKLTNPYCAYSVNQNCPRPTKANTLPVEIRAGEMPFPAEPE